MKIMIPGFNSPMHLKEGVVNSLVIECPNCLLEITTDIYEQINKRKGNIILSENETVLDISKIIELITQFVPFDINRKTLVTKLQKDICDKSVQLMQETSHMELAELMKFLYELLDLQDFDLILDNVDVGMLLKCANVRFSDECSSFAEELYQYCKAVAEFESKRLFVFVNLRCYITEKEFELFSKTLIDHGLLALFVDNREYKRVANENRVVMDEDLCII